MRILSALRAVILPCLFLIAGCSTTEQFAKTSVPLATVVRNDMQTRYAADTAGVQLSEEFYAACAAGSREQAAPLWQGPDRLRARYVSNVENDVTLRTTPVQQANKKAKLDLVNDVDYILSIGAK